METPTPIIKTPEAFMGPRMKKRAEEMAKGPFLFQRVPKENPNNIRYFYYDPQGSPDCVWKIGTNTTTLDGPITIKKLPISNVESDTGIIHFKLEGKRTIYQLDFLPHFIGSKREERYYYYTKRAIERGYDDKRRITKVSDLAILDRIKDIVNRK